MRDLPNILPPRMRREIEAAFAMNHRPTLTAAQAAARDWPLSEFVKAAWKIVEPATPLVWNWHLDCICLHLSALVDGKLPKRNMILNVPPGSMKTSIVGVCLLPWIWITRPWYRAVFISANPRVTSITSVKCRQVLESNWYRNAFGIEWSLSEDQNE